MLRPEAGRNPISGSGLPLAIESSADLPSTAADADEPAIVEIDVGFAIDDVDTKMGVEPNFHTGPVFVAVTVRRSMRRRAWPMGYDMLVSLRCHDDSLATYNCDDYHQCSKKFCQTKHDRYPLLVRDYRSIQVSP